MPRAKKTDLCVLAIWLLLPTSIQANIGPRWWGDPTAEPLGGIKDVVITREQLTVDLRPLAKVEPVRIEVAYYLHNPGRAKKLDLFFVVGVENVQDFEVRLGDRLIERNAALQQEASDHWSAFPHRWEDSHRLPGIEAQETWPWISRNGHKTVAFSVELASGPSTLQVRYRAKLAGVDENHYPTATWQFPYILSPAIARPIVLTSGNHNAYAVAVRGGLTNQTGSSALIVLGEW